MRSSLILGISGQDGYYLTRLLLAKNIAVIGIVRDKNSAAVSSFSSNFKNVVIVEWDMKDPVVIESILSQYNVDKIYNLAALASGSGMFDEPVNMGDINGLSIVRILEAIRKLDRSIKFCQASSSEVFGEATSSPQTESTVRNPRSLYGSAKMYADSVIGIYRRHYGLFACSAILYNHESPRRDLRFVSRWITRNVAEIKCGIQDKLYIGNLEAKRDWGYAGDYVNAMYLMLQQEKPEDYVIATGIARTVRDFCDCAFSYLSLDYRDYVFVDESYLRPNEPMVLVGDPTKAHKILGWSPSVSFEQMVRMMIDSDLALIKSSIQGDSDNV